MAYNYTNNEILIKRLKKGDEKAYAFLLDEYYHRLCVYANSLVKDHDKAEDIVQNVFLKTWEQRERLKSDFSIKSFFYKSVYNEFIDQYRKNQSTLALEKKYIEALDTIIEEKDVESIERLIAIVEREIQNLPPKCKEVFMLSKREGLTNIEISEYQNISIKTVEAQITKAFSILRKKLDKLDVILFLLFGANHNHLRNNL